MSSVESQQLSHLQTMLSVSRKILDNKEIPEILDHIAFEAARAVGAQAAAIILVDRSGRLRLGGGWDVMNYTRKFFDEAADRRSLRSGPSGRADTLRTQVAISDMSTHPQPESDPPAGLIDWRLGSIAEGIRAMVATPLNVGGDIVGILNVYRAKAGPWQQQDLDLLSFLADHAAAAMLAANLIERQHRQLEGLERVVRNLREQTHEHANRVHSAAMLIAMGEPDEASRFITQLVQEHDESHHQVMVAVGNHALAGLISAEVMIARQSGIRFRIDRRTKLPALLGPLGEPESVALLAHLFGCAFEAIADVPADRRRVTFRADARRDGVRLSIRHWGGPVGAEFDSDEQPVRRLSISEALLLDAVSSAGGTVRIEPKPVGGVTIVWIPL